MRIAVKTISDICNSSNKRLCLSALRALERCFECDKYDSCESRIINGHYNHLITLKEEAYMKYTKVIGDIDEAIQLL